MKGALFAFVVVLLSVSVASPAMGLIPYARSLVWPEVEDPFRILEQSPLNIPKLAETQLALARADWKETPQAHVITLDVPGVKREDIKIEVEDNRVLRISGERAEEKATEGDKWHRAERTSGKFWRQFRMPANSDMDAIRAHLESGVLRVTVPKVAEVKRQPKLVNIVEETNKGQDLKASSKSDA
ncbi:22.7 kDa class IV heat shock protein-like [Iris pallida]|uniref:22.7 kDa class IV heat shock protein-like n=1 Tax=Iris pallida TaxID=29817 RepID=A0AAX6G9E5_IRIPA|nr:22.7 kDa class IV heat shock protein-like [Iris pallida]